MKTQAIRNGRAVIFEIKVAETFGEMEKKCEEALKQIETQKYEEGLRSEGYKEVLKYGICFYKKECIAISG